MKYEEQKLSELVDTISDTRKIDKDKVVLVNTSDVLAGEVLNHTYTENCNLRGQFKKRFKTDDILYSEIRPANKRFAYIDFDSEDYIASTKLMVLRRKSDKITNRYLYYCLTNDLFVDRMQHLAEARSGTFPQITFDVLKGETIYLPSIDNQNKITSILDNINNKIRLNNEIYNNLYELGISIFNNMYDGNDTISIKFGDIVTLLRDGTHNPPKRVENGVPLLTGQTINNGFIEYDKMTYVSSDDYKKIHAKYEPKENDLVLTKIGTVGKVGILRRQDIPMCIHCNSALIRFDEKYLDQFTGFWFLNSNYFQIEFNKAITNTVQDFVSLGAMSNLEIKIPNINIVNVNKEVLKNTLLKMSELNNENSKLTNMRDTLLPKLMNGEIDLDNIEI